MSFCQSCGTSVEADAHFCPRCGKPANIGVLSTPPQMSATASPGLPLAASTTAAPQVPATTAPAVAVPAHLSTPAAVPAKHHKMHADIVIIAIAMLLCMCIAIPTAFILLYYAGNVSLMGETPLAQLLIALFPIVGAAKTDLVSALNLAALESFAIAGVAAASCYGLLRLREWGRILAIVGIALAMVHALIVIFTGEGNLFWHVVVLGLQTWAFLYLLKDRTKLSFAK